VTLDKIMHGCCIRMTTAVLEHVTVNLRYENVVCYKSLLVSFENYVLVTYVHTKSRGSHAVVMKLHYFKSTIKFFCVLL